MEVVAEKLVELAKTEADPVVMDKLGRSAFNRYYYAAFLRIRSVLGSMRTEWRQVPHKNLPRFLKENVSKEVKASARKALRYNVIKQADASSLITTSRKASSDLAELLELAYSVRLVADYAPEIPLGVKAGKLSLKSTTVDAAAQWARRAEMLSGQLLWAWRQLGIS